MNRAVLGINAYSHDAGAALIVDGRLVFASSEERFTRIKHTPVFPSRAIRAALHHAGLEPGDLDAVAFPWRRDMARIRKALYVLRRLPRSLAFLRERQEGLSPRLEFLRGVAGLADDLKEIGIVAPVHHIDHHLAHAVQAHRFGPADNAALLTVDGMGEWTAAAIWQAAGDRPTLLRSRSFPHSVGKFYSAITQHLGFRPESGEGKTMGLAPYGRDRLVDAMRTILQPDAERLYRVDLDAFDYPWGRARMTGDAFAEQFGPARGPHDPLEAGHQDLAFAAQVVLEEVMLEVARRLREKTGAKHLGLAGGTFLNCVLNARLRDEAGFATQFVFPAAGDAGAAAGAAAWVARMPRTELTNVYLGEAFGAGRIDQALEGRRFEIAGDPADVAAEALAKGQLVGWFSGRMEFGPRALGARSILADARDPEVHDRLNRTVKFREDFRPLAPAALLHKAAEWFEGVTPSPFMLETFQVREKFRQRIPSVVHVDGSARVQTVAEGDGHPAFLRLLERFEARTGVPLVVNTSFNVRGEPIVRTPEEALDLFERTALDLLVIEDRVLTKR